MAPILVKQYLPNSITLLPNFETTGNFDAFIVPFDPDPPYSPPILSSSDGSDMNYIYTRSMRVPVECYNCNVDDIKLDTFKTSYIAEQVQYFDGLGRLVQDIQIKTSPAIADIIKEQNRTLSRLPKTRNHQVDTRRGNYRRSHITINNKHYQMFFNPCTVRHERFYRRTPGSCKSPETPERNHPVF